jgi:serine/threonine protein kinase
MSDDDGERPDQPDPSKVRRLTDELRSLDRAERESRLGQVDLELAEAVRLRLLDQTIEVNDSTNPTIKDPSEAVTIDPGFKGDPPQMPIRESSDDPLPPTHRQLVGQALGPYAIQRLIGSGGMGQVWEAIQENPKRSVALKILRAGIISPAAKERFKFEVDILGRLRHPNIAQIYDAGEMDLNGEIIPYFAMEFIGGAQQLDEYCRRKNMDMEGKLKIFAKVCEAVSHGHQRGIIHRDLKPANILVDREGRPKVIDYGVARVTDADSRSTIAKTNVGQLIGTLQYMSPEQCTGDPDEIDIRADVYSLGMILFELIAEQPPYDLRRAAIGEALQIIQNQLPPRLSSFDRAIAYDIEIIAGKALEKQPERRYRSAGDLADDVIRFLEDEPINARPPSMNEIIRRYARKNRAMATAVIGIFLALAIGVSGIIVFAIQAEKQRVVAVETSNELSDALLKEEAARELSETRFEQVRSLATELLGPIASQVKNLGGSDTARMMIIESGRRYLEELHAQSIADTDLTYEIAKGYEQLGDLLGGRQTGSIGKQEEALVEFAKAERIYRDQIKNGPNDGLRRGDLSRVLQKQGEVLMSSDMEAATKRYKESRSLAVQVHEELGGNRESTIRLASILMKTGDLLDNAGESGRAMVYYDEARGRIASIIDEENIESDLQRHLALLERRIAWILEAREALPEAGKLWKSSLERVRSNSRQLPNDNRRRWDVAWSCYHYGSFLLLHTDDVQGPDLMAESLALMTTVCVASPNQFQYRNDLAQLASAMHEELSDTGHVDVADRSIKECILILQPTVESLPDNVGLGETHASILKLQKNSSLP